MRDYFWTLFNAPETKVDPPLELVLYEGYKKFNQLPYEGTWFDQPWWLIEAFNLIEEVMESEQRAFEAKKKAQKSGNIQGSGPS